MDDLPEKSSERLRIKNTVILGLLMSMVIVFTITIRIPTPIGGYINPGDIIVIFSGYLLGSRKGALIGAIGSALADLLGGYPVFAGITFLAKGGEGYLAGLIGKDINVHDKTVYLLFAGILAGLWMVLLYFIGEWLYWDLTKSIISVLPNIIQAVIGIVSAITLYKFIGKKLKL